jgi:hypothetical protein
MDDLIKSIKECKLSQKDLNLLDLLEEIEKIEPKQNKELEEFRRNYYKLKYLDDLFRNNVTLEYDQKYLQALTNYLFVVDKKTTQYLVEINWECAPDCFYDSTRIKTLLKKSLKIETRPVKKLQTLMRAYKIIITFLEEKDFPKQNQIDDDDFLDIFQPSKKRR